jgi:hypothetical protein
MLWGLIIFLIGCTNQQINSNDQISVPPEEIKENKEEDKSPVEILTVEETASNIVGLLSKRDLVSLAEYVHPTKGVRFTPYGYINLEEDQGFSSIEITNLWDDDKTYLWGYYDGTGDPIELTFREYYSKFIYDVDFADAEEISVNKRLGQGNSLDNSKIVYQNGTVVEFHFSGFDKQYDGMDWKSLRLVLEKVEDKWFLIGIIHDQWTI